MLASLSNVLATPATFTRRRMRNEMVQWLSREQCSHALTLVANRSLSVPNLRKMFGEFCLDMDRACLGKRNVGQVRSGERLFAIAFVEHPETNIHLHVAMRLSGWWQSTAVPVDRQIDLIWKTVTGGSGNTVLRKVADHGWGWYITKEASVLAGEFFLSGDYHPSH